MATPKMTDVNLLIAAGFDPKTGLPYRMTSSEKANLKPNIRKVLRIVDEQDAINRYVWHNLPKGLNSQLLERILYYKGQGAFFYMPSNETFYFLPYALNGSIDVYGRFTSITPLPFNGSTANEKGAQDPWIKGLSKTPIYNIILPEDLTLSDFENSCVLLHDYSCQLSQTNIARQVLNDPLLDVMADCIPFMRTALLNSTGVTGIRVNGQEGAQNVLAASTALDAAALQGEKYIPIVDAIEMQDLTGANTSHAEEFLLSMQALDNFRLSLYGLDNGGLFQKKAHKLEAEQRTNSTNVGIIMQDGLTNRQHFCDIINSIWGLGVTVSISETISNTDANYDGMLADITNEIDTNNTTTTEEEGQAHDTV